MWNKIKNHNLLELIGIFLGLFLLFLTVSFLLFTFGYWLITLILFNFFSFILPFSLQYAFGAWLIFLIISFFCIPGIFATKSSN